MNDGSKKKSKFSDIEQGLEQQMIAAGAFWVSGLKELEASKGDPVSKGQRAALLLEEKAKAEAPYRKALRELKKMRPPDDTDA